MRQRQPAETASARGAPQISHRVARWGTAAAVLMILAVGFVIYDSKTATPGQPKPEAETVQPNTAGKSAVSRREDPADKTAAPDARRAFGYLVKVCRIGPRPSGSRGMAQQQKLITEHFTKHGADVRLQSFDVAHPQSGTPVRMNNVIVSWDKEAKERVLLACHYDTRPFPDRDPVNPRGRFIGANDGASGVALFMELAHHMPDLKPTYGVDFVFFDGEELVYGPQDKYFLGSEHFARQYRDRPPDHRYVWGVLVDMVADRRLQLYQERNSLEYAPRLVESIWSTARELGVREFIARPKHEIRDDHLPLNDVAGIPSCDIIDFDYGPRGRSYWHTMQDVPSNCSGASLQKVARVLLRWLTEVPKPQRRG